MSRVAPITFLVSNEEQQRKVPHSIKMSMDWGDFHYSYHSRTPGSLLPKESVKFQLAPFCVQSFNVNIAVFHGLAASPLTRTSNFKGTLHRISEFCIKNVNLGDMITTQGCMWWNSNQCSGKKGKEKLFLFCFSPDFTSFVIFFHSRKWRTPPQNLLQFIYYL